jgi:hydroxymethylpyrimidine/phosphomethylpyrimidine kinase
VAAQVVTPAIVALTIAGTDSSGGAGITADVRTFASLGVRGTVAVTAVTAQGRDGVVAAATIEPGVVGAQIAAVAGSFRVGAAKTGMLATAGVASEVAAAVRRLGIGPLVVDPVLAATRGGSLLDDDAVQVVVSELLPLSAVLTPNLAEAAALLGAPAISDRAGMEEAAPALAGMGRGCVLLKGGHLGGTESPDLLWLEGRPVWLEAGRVAGPEVHGTGCALSAAITAFLARGAGIEESCRRAKDFVGRLISESAR